MNSTVNTIMVLVGYLCLILFLAIPIMLPVSFVIARRRGHRVLAVILGILSLIAFAGLARIGYAMFPLGDKLVARTTTRDGTDIVLYQRCNYSLEPYHTHFYFREPEGRWQSFQMDFEDSRWISGRIYIDPGTDLARIYRGDDEVAQFDLHTHAFTMGNYTQTNAYVYQESTITPWKK